ISYSDAIQKILNREIDKPYLVLSSDDGFKSNLAAASILQEFGFSACFFVNPSIVGETDKKKISEYCDAVLNFPPVEFLTWNDIDTMLKMGHEIGSHSMNHIRIAETTVDIVKEDLGNSFSILKQRCGEAKHFAFPYGKFTDFSEMGRASCFEAGFYSCASAERGSHINNATKITNTELCIRRDHVVFDWKFEHIMYFLKRSSINARSSNNLFKLNA
ncbi:MAG: polysaccharide deacetylase family protein, partial [Cytophagales bacterium]